MHTGLKYFESEKSIKKNLTIPSWLAEKADEASVNYSQTLQEALKEKIATLV